MYIICFFNIYIDMPPSSRQLGQWVQRVAAPLYAGGLGGGEHPRCRGVDRRQPPWQQGSFKTFFQRAVYIKSRGTPRSSQGSADWGSQGFQGGSQGGSQGGPGPYPLPSSPSTSHKRFNSLGKPFKSFLKTPRV